MIAALLTFAALFLPGIVFLSFFSLFPRLHTVEKIPVAVALSLSYWIFGFWTLSIIPIPHTWFIAASLIAFFLLSIPLLLKMKLADIREPGSQMWLLVFLLMLALPPVITALSQIAPSGADMSMHAYFAKIIYLTNGFPHSMRPLVPIDRIGLYTLGFPAVVSTLMHINRLPVYTNALILTALTYWILPASLYVFLRSRFSVILSIPVTVLISWGIRTPFDFIDWGANPTVLSFAFIILSIAFLSEKISGENILLAGIFFCTAFLTHYILPVAVMYVGLFCLPFFWKRLREIPVRLITLSLLLCSVLMMPFVVHMWHMPLNATPSANAFVARLQMKEFPGSMNILHFVTGTIGKEMLALYLVAIAVSFLVRKRIGRLHVPVIIGVLILITNAHVWLLPLSPLLYPQRVILLLILPIAYGIAQGLDDSIIGEIRKYRYSPGVLYLLNMLVLGYFFYPTIQNNLLWFWKSSTLSVVTRADLAAFDWIATHTNRNDIIMNNYEDAGLWIPAITNRAITLYHTNPFDMDVLRTSTESAAFAYVGNKSTSGPSNRDPVNTTDFGNKPDSYTLVYRNRYAAIYKIRK